MGLGWAEQGRLILEGGDERWSPNLGQPVKVFRPDDLKGRFDEQETTFFR